ncbi:pilus assembly protein TadB [Dehalobacter sp. MCB1]|uniref:type II secretion system F family protein n=1 Tax=unclassified Dehalobacter TaxID=2635733 RepID=UPI000E6BDA66|nr:MULTISPECIES: type II secretion system F family protein [unclassified Dehalobacter]RJE47898.1 pilus assembly protein TadB [Dehalobacter sp. MCB1]TCX56076.1 pilus assembly protein TadB [Dehalobacter sp. 12DCB1]
MNLILCYGMSIGLLIILFAWFFQDTEKRKITGYVKRRLTSIQERVLKETGLINKIRILFDQRKEIIQLNMTFKTFVMISIIFFIFTLVGSICMFKLTVPGIQGSQAVVMKYNVLAIVIVTFVGGIFPWLILNIVYYSTRKLINKQALNTFTLILNNYIVRNNLEAATWDSIEGMPSQMKSLFSRIQTEVNGGESFDQTVLRTANILKIQAFRDFYNTVHSAVISGGNTDENLYRLIGKIRSKKIRAQTIKEDLSPLISKAIVFTIVMVVVYFAVGLFWPDSMMMVKQSSIGVYYTDSIIIAILIEVGLLLKYLSMED